jgi:hypothetical protein
VVLSDSRLGADVKSTTYLCSYVELSLVVFGNFMNSGRRFRENSGFVCEHCSVAVDPLRNGSYRNHCPYCLFSLHVDMELPGDRSSECGGLMEPSALVRSRKGYQIVHRCQKCGIEKKNVVAQGLEGDEDSIEALIRLPIRV